MTDEQTSRRKTGSMPIGRLFVFLVFLSGIVTLLHYYLWARLVRDPEWPAPWGVVGTTVLVGLGVLVAVFPVLSRTVSRSIVTPVAWVGYVWLGLVFYLILFIGLEDVVRLVVWLVRRGEPDPWQSVYLSRILAGGTLLVAVGLTVAAVVSARSPLAVKEVPVTLEKLSPRLDGFTIVQLTDLHVGPTIGRAYMDDVVARTNALAPDVVAITGDLVDGSVAELAQQVEPLARLRAKHGVFFVTGNHEYYAGVGAWLSFLPTLGIRVLRNEHVQLDDTAGDGIDLAGIDDHDGARMGHGGPDLTRATLDRDERRPLVLLAHQPKAIVEASSRGVDLQLSGHTHGGQIFPWGFFVRLQQPYVAGLHRHGATQLYVSCGTGYWGPPMRLGAPAEITRIVLSSTSITHDRGGLGRG